jgi:MFS family permease
MRHSLADRVAGALQADRSIFSFGLWVMTLTHILTHVFMYVHTTLFPILQDEFSLSLQQLGLIAAIPALCQALLYIPAGLLSDRLGSRLIITAALAIATGGAFLASQALTPIMLIVAVSLMYINTTLYHPAAYSFVTRFFDPKTRLKALGIYGAGGTLGTALGPISISILMGIFALSWRQVYLFWCLPLLLGIVAVLFLRSAPKDDVAVKSAVGGPGVAATTLLSSNMILFLVHRALRAMGYSMSQTFMALFLVDERGFSKTATSTLIGLTTLVGIGGAMIGGFLAVKYGEKRWLISMLFLAYLCYSLAILVPSNMVLALLFLSYGLLRMLTMAANAGIMARLSPGKQRGMAYALYFLPGAIMGAAAPLIAASIGDAFGLVAIFYTTIVLYLLSLAVLQFGVRLQPST